MKQGHVISERVHHRKTGSLPSTSATYKPEKCLLISVPVLLNADWLKILPVTMQLYIDMFRYERNGRNDAAARTTSNYQLVQRIQQPNGFAQRTYQTSFTFIPSGSFNGFYIGFKDTGTCVNIQRIQIYYNKFIPVAPSPVICPETGLPPAGTTASVTCSCPANSNPTSSLQMTCHSDGTCTGNPTCQCNEGYQTLSGQCRGANIFCLICYINH